MIWPDRQCQARFQSTRMQTFISFNKGGMFAEFTTGLNVMCRQAQIHRIEEHR